MAPIDVLRRSHPGLIGHATARSCFLAPTFSGPSKVARLDRSGSLMSSVLLRTSGMLCRFCMGFCLKQPCSTAHRARGSGGSAPRPPRAGGQTPVYQHSLPCFPEATAFCGAGFWIRLLSPRSLPFLSLKVVALAAFVCFLRCGRPHHQPLLKPCRSASRRPAAAKPQSTVPTNGFTVIAATCLEWPSQWAFPNVLNRSITLLSARRCARTSPP